ncbi:hypothetical protein GCM10010911_25070 [Paenibacillus nasutitermitis]|uniref:Uncharacterized protein n=1 Tax=Paenibacillus nasutitermitis TaxID=1652958 RepID=A0A917DTW5_9BACL|nr:hypothetical protein GCM10010911_25070 [Paenibacillus nasutitermitis]
MSPAAAALMSVPKGEGELQLQWGEMSTRNVWQTISKMVAIEFLLKNKGEFISITS